MHPQVGRIVRPLLLGVLLASAQAGISTAASPTTPVASQAPQTPPSNGTLSVSPPLISLAVAPGGSATTQLTVRSGVLQDVKIATVGLSQTPDGGFQPVVATQDTSPYSGRSMIAFSPDSFRMQPGGSQTVTVTVNVPSSAGDGVRYAILKITGLPVSGTENVGFGMELGVSSIITLKNTNQTHSGTITDLAVGKPVSGQPLVVTGTIDNTGNSHYGAAPNQVNAAATLTNSNGTVVASGKTVLSGNSIVPTFGRQFSISLKTGAGLSDGRYHLETTAALQDGTILDTKTLDFEVSGGQVLGATGAPGNTSGGNGGPESGMLILILGGLAAALLAMVVVNVLLYRRRRQNRPAAS
jgi:hypothetical protein